MRGRVTALFLLLRLVLERSLFGADADLRLHRSRWPVLARACIGVRLPLFVAGRGSNPPLLFLFGVVFAADAAVFADAPADEQGEACDVGEERCGETCAVAEQHGQQAERDCRDEDDGE